MRDCKGPNCVHAEDPQMTHYKLLGTIGDPELCEDCFCDELFELVVTNERTVIVKVDRINNLDTFSVEDSNG